MAIPCLNEEQNIGHLVRYLLGDFRSCTSRIVIADGGSRDRTPEIARELAAKHENVFYLHNPKRVQSAAVNLAVSAHGEGAEFLIRLDAHADYPEGYCQALVEEALEMRAASVVVTMRTMGKGGFQRAVAAAQNSRLGNGGSAHRMEATSGRWVDHGHHALIRRDAFQAVGGYDERASPNEDAELDIRLGKAGYAIWLTAKTTLIYYPRSSPASLLRQYLNYGRSRAGTLLKHRVRPKLRQMAPTFVLPAMLLALATPFFYPAVIPIMLWMAICLGYGVTLGAKERSAMVMLSGPAAMIMHLGWSMGFWRGMLSGRRSDSP